MAGKTDNLIIKYSDKDVFIGCFFRKAEARRNQLLSFAFSDFLTVNIIPNKTAAATTTAV